MIVLIDFFALTTFTITSKLFKFPFEAKLEVKVVNLLIYLDL